jgi:hypothetical protein
MSAPSLAKAMATDRPMPLSPAADQCDLALQLAGGAIVRIRIQRLGMHFPRDAGLMLLVLRGKRCLSGHDGAPG